MPLFRFFRTLWRNKTVNDVKKAVDYNLDDYKYKTRIEIRNQDFDIRGHINNAVYLTYMEIGRSKYWAQAINWNCTKSCIMIGQASIDYLIPILKNEPVSMYLRTTRIGQSSFDLEYLIVKTIGNQEFICSRASTVCIAVDPTTRSPIAIPIIEKSKMKEFEQL